MRSLRHSLCILPLLLPVFAACGKSPPPAAPSASTSAAAGPGAPAWIARSNEAARPLLEVVAKYRPERATSYGLEGYDDQVADLRDKHEERQRADMTRVKDSLQSKLATETDPLVKQDLEILVRAADQRIRASEAHQRYEVPFYRVTERVFDGLRVLLEDRIPPARQKLALTRLRRYAGLEPGSTPFTELARTETSNALANPGTRLPPSRIDVEKELQNSPVLVDGIDKLFQKYHLDGYQPSFATLKQQIAAYQDYLRKEVLPRTRTDFRMAPEVYAVELEGFGVDRKPEQLIALGHQGFDALQAEMQKVAAQIARARHLPSSDYRDVILALKKEQIAPNDVLPLYKKRLTEVEAIIAREHLVTLPTRPAVIRLGSEAENAALPAPHMSAPRLIGNTGEKGEFILPTSVPPPPGGKASDAQMDDFSYAAATWTLTAHEARPGHELQFASLVERGISLARAIFAANSANIEGWGLYSEYITYPFMPPEGQLVSLQFRLHRAARVFLDPELQQGKWTPEAARAFLQKEVVLSPGFANSEVERYTYKMPGQATSYFYGYTRMLELRRDVEARVGATKFDAQKFHDFILQQGLLPPNLLREAALKEFTGGGN
ncbi:DUF885 domain-containing protein [Pendulispora rubella]|uniref:DUF885 domain-containing protein n=1 Tax=Pendulispora rubella TaxID=2741070 RepID=A0ABZ2L0H3_9BACT